MNPLPATAQEGTRDIGGKAVIAHSVKELAIRNSNWRMPKWSWRRCRPTFYSRDRRRTNYSIFGKDASRPFSPVMDVEDTALLDAGLR